MLAKLINKQLLAVVCASTLILLSAGCSKPSDSEAPSDSDSNQAEEPKAEAGNALRPNFVFILADDIGFGDLGVNGLKNFATPNLDQLANIVVLKVSQCIFSLIAARIFDCARK